MIIDCQSTEFRLNYQKYRKRIFVDGVEIHQVFYVDTDAGFVRTYDVLGDRKTHATREFIPAEIVAAARDKDYAAGRIEPWGMPPLGAMSKVIRGVVTLAPWP